MEPESFVFMEPFNFRTYYKGARIPKGTHICVRYKEVYVCTCESACIFEAVGERLIVRGKG